CLPLVELNLAAQHRSLNDVNIHRGGRQTQYFFTFPSCREHLKGELATCHLAQLLLLSVTGNNPGRQVTLQNRRTQTLLSEHTHCNELEILEHFIVTVHFHREGAESSRLYSAVQCC